jgi:drug/metabolite transporter (DMT)-like permease
VLDLALPLADLFPHSPGPYIALMLAGFAIGILGHVFRVKAMVIAGVVLIFLGTLLFPLAANLTTNNRPPPIDESRGDAGPP